MNIHKLVRYAALAAVGAIGLSAYARDLVWLGNAKLFEDNKQAGYDIWSLTNANWYVKGDANKTRVCFADGDNAYFLDDEWEISKAQMITTPTGWNHEFNVGAIVISNDTKALTWCCNRSYVDASVFQAKSIDIYGSAQVNTWVGFAWNCNFNVHGGEFYSAYHSDHPSDARNSTGSLLVNRNIVFNDAKYTTNRQGFGGIGNGGKLSLFFTNSTFKVDTSDYYCNIPKGTFYNSTFEFTSNTAEDKSVVFSGNKYIFAGNKPTTIPGNRSVVFGKTRYAPATLEVADVTGDDNPDLILNAVLGKFYTYSWWGSTYDYGNYFTKTGPGTMLINSSGSGSGTCGSMTGNVQVVEGTLAVTNECPVYFDPKLSALGAINDPGRTITVKEKGTLEFWSQCFGPLNNPRNFKIAVEEGGKMICHNCLYLGQLLLHGGEFSYTNGSQVTWIEYGLFSIGKKISFANRVYDLNLRGNHQVMYLGFDESAEKDTKPIDATHPHLTNFWSVVEMAVADVTGDAGVDASICLPMRDMKNQCYPEYGIDPNNFTYDPWKWCRFRAGIRKTGAGTFRIYGESSYTHTTEVAEGTLRVDSAITSSSGATVEAGAYLGGTGTVCAVTMKANGGLELDASRTGWLKIPSLAAEGAVNVHVVNAATSEDADNKVVCEITSKPSTLNLTNWSVKFGDATNGKGLVLAYDAATGKVTAHKVGMILIVK